MHGRFCELANLDGARTILFPESLIQDLNLLEAMSIVFEVLNISITC